MTINEIQDEIIEEFAGFDDWMDKYQLLIDLGNDQEPLLHRADRVKGTFVAHPLQWLVGYGEADAHVCLGLQGKRRLMLFLLALVIFDFLEIILTEVTPMVIRGDVCRNRQRRLLFVM